jgi:hypothetical protein
MTLKRIGLGLVILIIGQCRAQDSTSYPKPTLSDSVSIITEPVLTDGFLTKPGFTGKKIVATTMVGAWLATSLVWSYDAWWKGTSSPFTFTSENTWLNSSTLGIDKIGHFYTSYFYFNTFRSILLWGGYEQPTAEWWAAGVATFFALSVEIGDGFAAAYGFDYQDLTFNLLGVGYGWLQHHVPALDPFGFKWSFVPASGYRFPVRFTDDYDAHTYWLTCDVDKLLPESIEPYWPDFIQIAVGYGVDDRVTKREFVIGFDLNLLELFKPRQEDLLLITRTVDLFHLPAPAIKFTEEKEPRYYLFHRN